MSTFTITHNAAEHAADSKPIRSAVLITHRATVKPTITTANITAVTRSNYSAIVTAVFLTDRAALHTTEHFAHKSANLSAYHSSF